MSNHPDLFHRAMFETKTTLKITEIGNNLKQNLEKKLAANLEKKCIPQGYVRANSVRIITYSGGLANGQTVEFHVVIECMLCYPVENMTIECTAKYITESAGIHAIVELDDGTTPLTIFITRDVNYANSNFSKVKEGSRIHARIIGVMFEVNDPTIYATATFIDPGQKTNGIEIDNSEEDLDEMSMFKPPATSTSPQPLVTQPKSDRVSNIVRKIMKDLPIVTKDNIAELVRTKSWEESMPKIYAMLREAGRKQTIAKNDSRQDYISDKLTQYLHLTNEMKVVDIGGGNGDVLHNLAKSVKGTTDKSNFICVETQNDWTEEYTFPHKDITYLNWDNNTINVPDSSVDYVLCMVSLHHMSDTTLSNALNEIYRVLKPNGKLLMKEHDCVTTDDKKIIDAEHHLYHLLDLYYSGATESDTKEYLSKIIHNFKTRNTWHTILATHKLELTDSFNRFMDKNADSPDKNVTNLYWDVFTKSQL